MRTTKLRFRFELTPLAKIEPWGDDKPTLHWFGLTDGLFWIEAGDTELFRYTDAISAHWVKQSSQAGVSPYQDYQVSRYWEDLLDLLPTVLTSLREDFAQKVGDSFHWHEWLRRAEEWYDASPEERYDVYHEATIWWHRRQWWASHLAYQPNIWLWRESETVHIRWDNSNKAVDSIPVWTATRGQLSLPVTDFVAAVQYFNDALLTAMNERVGEVMNGGLSLKIDIDIEGLHKDQANRTAWLKYYSSYREEDVDWKATRSAIDTISEEMRR